MKITIYHGTSNPFTAIGKHQCNLLDFAFKYQTWHSYSTDKATNKALLALQSKGAIILNNCGQFKINM